MYVTSVLGSTISVINPESGEIVKTYGPDDGVIGPDDVDFFRWELVLDFYHDWPGGRF